MKKITIAAASIAALACVPAFAADLGRPITKAPAMVAPAPVMYNTGWSGFYIGGQVGYQYGYVAGYHPDGIVGGGHIGFNYQTGPVVFGIEGDIEGSGVNGGYPGFDQRWQSSIRGRLGFTAGNSVLFYGTGGAAFSEFRANALINGFDSGYANTVSRTGYTLGAGIEYKFTPNFSGRVEYRYTDFGNLNDPRSDARPRIEFSTVRVGLSYYFGGFGGGLGGGAPVMAAY